MQDKHTRKPFKHVYKDNTMPQPIHSDVCDSSRQPTPGGNKYFVTFIDNLSKLCYINLLKIKDEVFNKFKIYKAEVETQLEQTIKILRFDRGGKYISNKLT